MFGNLEDMKKRNERSRMMAEIMEDMMIEMGTPSMKTAFTLGKEMRKFSMDMRRLLCAVDRPEEEAMMIYADALEYVRLAHEGLLSFIEAHTEKYGKDVIDEPF